MLIGAGQQSSPVYHAKKLGEVGHDVGEIFRCLAELTVSNPL